MSLSSNEDAPAALKRSMYRESILTLSSFTAAGIVLAIVLALLLRGSKSHLLFLVVALIPCTILLGVAVICYVSAAVTRYQGPLRAGNISAGLFILGLLQVPGLVIGDAIVELDVLEAKRFCEALVDPLDQFQLEHGQYPEKINELLPSSEGIPRLLGKNFYRSDGEVFSFEVHDPSEMMGFYDYSSENRKWTHWAFLD